MLSPALISSRCCAHPHVVFMTPRLKHRDDPPRLLALARRRRCNLICESTAEDVWSPPPATTRYCEDPGREGCHLQLLRILLSPGDGREPLLQEACMLLNCKGGSELDPMEVRRSGSFRPVS